MGTFVRFIKDRWIYIVTGLTVYFGTAFTSWYLGYEETMWYDGIPIVLVIWIFIWIVKLTETPNLIPDSVVFKVLSKIPLICIYLPLTVYGVSVYIKAISNWENRLIDYLVAIVPIVIFLQVASILITMSREVSIPMRDFFLLTTKQLSKKYCGEE